MTAGETATVTLVAIVDCHATHNVKLENVKPEEKGYIERFLKSHGYQVVERPRRRQEQVHDYHTAVRKFLDRFSGKARYANTVRKGGLQ